MLFAGAGGAGRCDLLCRQRMDALSRVTGAVGAGQEGLSLG